MRYSLFVGLLTHGLLLGVGGLAFGQPSGGNSLWNRREHRAAFLFEDNRGRRVGDLLTIQVNESTNVADKEARNLDKTASFMNVFNFKGSSSAGKNVSRSGQASLEFDGTSNRKFDGAANYSSNRQFTDQITVVIIDVLPNGNLVVEGYRSRLVSREQRMLRITGIVRPTDIGAQNTVQSQFIGNFQIAYVGRGPETVFTNQSYFSRAMNIIWPF